MRRIGVLELWSDGDGAVESRQFWAQVLRVPQIPASTPTLHHAIFFYHAHILSENEFGSKCTVRLTRFFIKKSKWTLPPILPLLAGDLWCFTFEKKGGGKRKLRQEREIYFFRHGRGVALTNGLQTFLTAISPG